MRHLVRKEAPPSPPKSITVLVVPANGAPPDIKTLDTVETDIAAFNTPPDLHGMERVVDARLAHMVYHYEDSTCQPNINFLPDLKRHGYWDDEAWKYRCVTGTAKFHFLFTRSTSGLTPNPHVGNRVSGDIFILKVSDIKTKDRDGRNVYVGLNGDDLEPKGVSDLLQTFSPQRQ